MVVRICDCVLITITLTHWIVTEPLNSAFKLQTSNFLFLQVNFVGVTVDTESYYVHFPTTRHLFEPVPVGGTSPPVQVYELYNGGSRAVNYELDMEPLAQVQAVSIFAHSFSSRAVIAVSKG